MPQDAALFRHLDVRRNLAFALELRRWPRSRVDARVEELASWLGIGSLLDRSTEGLSGGEAQRVALGRALSASPDVLCLDEPLSALDDETRDEICGVLEEIRRRTRVTVLYITHHQQEARRLADVLLTLHQGSVTTSPRSANGDRGQGEARPTCP